MDIDKRANYCAVVDMLENKLVSHINNVYTNFIREVNVCVTTILTTANSSADALEDYLKKEVSDLKSALQWDNYETNLMYDNYLPMGNIDKKWIKTELKKMSYEDDIENKNMTKAAINADLNSNFMQEEARIDEMLSLSTTKMEPLTSDQGDETASEFKEFTFSTEDLKSDTDPANLTYKEKRALAKERMEYKRQNGLLWRQKREQAKAMKELKKVNSATEKNISEYYKEVSGSEKGSDPDWVDDENASLANLSSLDYKQKRQLAKERMEFKRKNGLLLRQKKEKQMEKKSKKENAFESSDQTMDTKLEMKETE